MSSSSPSLPPSARRLSAAGVSVQRLPKRADRPHRLQTGPSPVQDQPGLHSDAQRVARVEETADRSVQLAHPPRTRPRRPAALRQSTCLTRGRSTPLSEQTSRYGYRRDERRWCRTGLCLSHTSPSTFGRRWLHTLARLTPRPSSRRSFLKQNTTMLRLCHCTSRSVSSARRGSIAFT